MAKPRKIRFDFRKNRSGRCRGGDLTRSLGRDPDAVADQATSERLSGKGDLTRKRTVIDAGDGPADPALSWRGQVLHVHGLESFVRREDGSVARCTTRRVLRTLVTNQRHPVVAGDWVVVRSTASVPSTALPDASIHSVETRRNEIARSSRGRRHVIVANVDQLLIVGSAAEPHLKPGLIDRLLVAAESSGIQPMICLNKADLVPAATLVPLAGVYARMGYRVVLCSTVTGMGLDRLRVELRDRVTAVVGQSGVGKSSILNWLEPGLVLPIGAVSRDNDKGRHTTTTARLLPHSFGGSFVDTPGVRQFQLWEIVPAEVPAAFRDLRPIANLCRFPDCTHSHETDCGVKHAVADGLLDTRRWESCCHLAANLGDTTEDDE
ncbi:MAG: ribosome small subunit-dependent GTPase A [Planctomycetota bacterium]|nr:MAG: ribosome small subunit-dependent GTPase A [Planctomycetota bacterium]